MNAPLSPDPKWRNVNNGGFISQQVSNVLIHPPAAYALGFENGAYALAGHVLKLLKEEPSKAVALLLEYENRRAHPARGWEHEPVRG